MYQKIPVASLYFLPLTNSRRNAIHVSRLCSHGDFTIGPLCVDHYQMPDFRYRPRYWQPRYEYSSLDYSRMITRVQHRQPVLGRAFATIYQPSKVDFSRSARHCLYNICPCSKIARVPFGKSDGLRARVSA